MLVTVTSSEINKNKKSEIYINIEWKLMNHIVHSIFYAR